MPFFLCRSGHPVVTPDQFLNFVGHLLRQGASSGASQDYWSGLAGGGSCQKVYCWWVGWWGLE